MIFSKFLFFSLCALLLLATSCNTTGDQQHLKLWYDQPADASVPDDPNGWRDDPEWLKGLPLGNGSLGAVVFGDVNYERIQLNEASMWSGSRDVNDNPDASMHLGKIRHLLFEGKYREATEIINRTQVCKGAGTGHGNGANVPFGCFQTLGDLWIDFDQNSPYSNYHRELDLDDAVARVSYHQGGTNFTREIFVSYPDQVMVMHFTADQPGRLSFTCTLNRPERYRTYVDEDHLVMTGSLHDGKGGDNLTYMARLKVIAENGSVTYGDSSVSVSEADDVTLLLAASTDYVLDYPDFKGGDVVKLSKQNIERAGSKSPGQLLVSHNEEYQQYFERVRFDITPEQHEPVPTDERLARFRETGSDLHLVELLFQYGRYLLISSSRPGTLPANLQGIWANKIQTPWNGDYHTDVNVQMNYWPAEVTNLPEMHLPLFDFVEMISQPGANTAEVQYNMNGWVVHPVSNVWGYTSPGEKAGWGLHSGGAAWISTHIYEHFRFTQDREFLERMFPVLEGAVLFYMDWLVTDPHSGKLVSGPAVSPENTFVAPDGSRSQFSMGPAHDQQVIWQLFSDYLDAAEQLKIDKDLVHAVEDARKDLAGPKTGSDGRLMEWQDEFQEVEPGHRHISHLFAIHPGAQINWETHPDLMHAGLKSLDYRIAHGGGHTGWSAAWLINQYARLHEAEKARESLHTVLKKSTSPNLFGLHPPFQADANFGTTAGIAEMLLQSHDGFLRLLPALPEEWKDGKVTGLRARGGYEVNMEWQDHQLTKAEITAIADGPVHVMYGDSTVTFNMRAGKKIKIRP